MCRDTSLPTPVFQVLFDSFQERVYGILVALLVHRSSFTCLPTIHFQVRFVSFRVYGMLVSGRVVDQTFVPRLTLQLGIVLSDLPIKLEVSTPSSWEENENVPPFYHP